MPPTPDSELKNRMQAKEQELRAGGREMWPIKIIETAGRPLERVIVNSDPFGGNQCYDKKCLPTLEPANKLSCRRTSVCYKYSCKICLEAGKAGDLSSSYFGETGKNMHCRSKEHVTKFNSKKAATREESAFYKHLLTMHGGVPENKSFGEMFEIIMIKAYKKPFTRNAEEGTFIANHKGEILNSKSEWHQPSIIRTRTTIVQGGAEQFLGGPAGQVPGRGRGC